MDFFYQQIEPHKAGDDEKSADDMYVFHLRGLYH